MAKQANRMMIGGFVVTAVIIMAASLVVFGSGKFFQKTNKYVLYFDESIKGLTVGAPVLFKGVQIGQVTSIVIRADLAKLQARIPVVIEIEPDRFQVSAEQQKLRNPEKIAAEMVERGLRAVLSTQSFITGQLAIELDFYPPAKVCFAPPQVDEDLKQYLVIPTCESATQKLANALGGLDLKGIERHLLSILAAVDKFVNSPDMATTLPNLKDTLLDARKLLSRVDGQVNPLADNMNKTVKDIGKLANNVDGRVGGMATGLDQTMSAARGFISQDSPLMVQLENTLQEIASMSRSFKQLANYLDQHPEALIRGKGAPADKSGGK